VVVRLVLFGIGLELGFEMTRSVVFLLVFVKSWHIIIDGFTSILKGDRLSRWIVSSRSYNGNF